MLNAIKVVDKTLKDIRIVVNGAGAAGMAITNLLMSMEAGDVILCDSRGPFMKAAQRE